MQFVFGLGETIVGGGLIIAPEPTLTKVGGVLVAAHGIDNTVAGWNQMFSGQETQSYTAQGLTKYHEWAGMKHNDAMWWAEQENCAISILFTSGGKYVLNSTPGTPPVGNVGLTQQQLRQQLLAAQENEQRAFSDLNNALRLEQQGLGNTNLTARINYLNRQVQKFRQQYNSIWDQLNPPQE